MRPESRILETVAFAIAAAGAMFRSLEALALAVAAGTLIAGCGGSPTGGTGAKDAGADHARQEDRTAGDVDPCIGSPDVQIQFPKDGTRFDFGQEVQLKGKAVPTDGGTDSVTVEWWSDVAGQMCTGVPESSGSTWCKTSSLAVGTHVVTLEATDACGATGSDSITIIINGAPTTPSVHIEPEAPTTTDNLVAVVAEPSDPNDDQVVLTYVWLKDDGPVAEITGATVGASYTKKGQTWTVKVTASDGTLAGETLSDSVVVLNTPPSVDSVSILPTSGGATATFTCVPDGWADPDALEGGSSEDYVFSWTVDGQVVKGETGDTISGLSKGDEVTCTVTPTDDEGQGEAVTSEPVTVVNTPPTCAAAVLSPDAGNVTTTFSCLAVDCNDADGDALITGYAWVLGGEDLPGTSSQDIQPKAFGASKGTTLQCRVVISDMESDGSPIPSEEIVLDNAPPSVTSAVVVPDATPPSEISVLACIPSGWSDPDGDPEAYVYTWYVNGVAVEGAEGPTLDGLWFNKGDLVDCAVVPDDGTTPGIPVESKNVVKIEDTAPLLGAAAIVPESGSKADTFECLVSGYSDPDPADAIESWPVPDPMDIGAPAILIQWKIDGGETAAIGEQWAPLEAKKGQKITCKAQAYDGELTGPPVESGEVLLLNAPPTVASVSLVPLSGGKLTKFTCTPSGYQDLDEGDPQSYVFSWSVNGVPVPGQELPEMAGSAAGLKPGDKVTCTVTPYDGQDFGPAVTSPEADVQNQLPSIASVVLTPGKPTVSDDITCTPQGFQDADGDVPLYKYAWTVDAALLGAQKASVLPKGTAKKGQKVVCQVVPYDGISDGFVVASAPVTVMNSAPGAPTVHIEPPLPAQGEELQCVLDVESSDADGDLLEYVYSWYLDGELLPGETAPALAGDSAAECSAVACHVAGSDSEASSEAAVAETVVDGTPGLFVDSMQSAVVVPDGPALRFPSQKLTAELWVRSAAPKAGALVSKRKLGPAAADRGFVLAILDDGKPSFVIDTGTLDGVLLVADAPLPPGKFNHVAGVYDGASARLFVNGVLVDAASVTGPIDCTEPLHIGVAPASASAVGAVIDEVRLSEEAVYAANFFPGMVLSAGGATRLLLHLDEGVGNALSDASASNSDGSCAACVWKQGMCALQTQDLPPTAPGVSISPAKPGPDDNLVCSVSQPSVDPEGKPIQYDYKWSSNTGKNAAGTTLNKSQTEANDVWTCTVTASDGVNVGPPGTASVTIQAGGVVPSGTYQLSPSVVYQCAWFFIMWMVDLNYSQLVFADNGATLTLQPAMNGGCNMTGPSAKSGTIDVGCTYFGSCNETYKLTGTFNGANWSGTLKITFQGQCKDCTTQTFNLTGTKL